MRPGLVFAALAAILSAGAAAGAESQDKLGALALVPKESVAFFHIPNLGALEDDLKRFGRETGLVIGHGDHPVLDLLSLRTGIKDGIDLGGSASIGFLDPKKYRERYSVYVLPVADWDALLKATVGEEMSPGLYALTGTAGPRYLARRGRYAVVTSSVRTMDAVASAEGIAGALPDETRARAAGPGPMVYLDVRRLCDIYADDITAWFRAASAQLYHQPETLAYADMLSAYLLGIANFLDQTQTLEASIRFEADGVAADVAMRFIKGGTVANFLSAQVPGSAAIPLPSDRPIESAVTISLDPAIRTDLIMKAARFFLAQAPRPEPLPEPTKRQVEEAVQMFAESLGPQMTFISAPAQPGLGAETGLTVLELKDPERFRKSLDLLAAAWEALADQLNLYVRFESRPEAEAMAGVPVTVFTPQFRFGIAARHVEFRERMKVLYGPEGLVYRVAVVGNQAVIASGSDKAMLMQTIERLKGGRAAEPSPAIGRLQSHLPAQQQVAMAMSLPLFIGQALVRGGTPPDRLGTLSAGQEVAGLAFQADGTTARMASYWPHEQIRMAMDLLKRAAPDMAEMPHTLFEPAPEGPPKPPVPGAAAPAPVPPSSPPAAVPEKVAPPAPEKAAPAPPK
ncbi:MAG: hypothetical protein NTX87_06725 [Planctomycetota bacterium]|nr:hypothetical protein [Planctomycetota bacterium]